MAHRHVLRQIEVADYTMEKALYVAERGSADIVESIHDRARRSRCPRQVSKRPQPIREGVGRI
jgi:hypothetical protein